MKRHLLAATTIALSLTLPAQALDISAMNADEREAFRSEIRDYLLENPEVIFEAVAVMEARQAEVQAQGDVELIADNSDGLFNDPQSWQGGNPEGDITLVEFLDYRCGYCRRAFEDVEQLVETDGNIRFIIKEFPILGEQSLLASRFAIATKQVAGDDAYKAVHDAMMTVKGDFNEVTLRRLAETLGLAADADAIMATMDSPEVDQVIAANHALGQRMDISGTPSFVMGDQMLRGYVPLDVMREIAEQIRAE